MKKYLFIFSMSMVCFNGFAESLYTCDLQKDLMLGSLSIGVFAASFFINGHPTHDSFSRDDVNGFDRILMFPYNENLDAIGSVVMYALLALPVMPMIKNRRDPNALLTYVIMYAEAFLLTHGTKDILKNSISRNRPYAYFGPVPSGLEDDYFKSFPSGHTSLAFMSAGFLTSVFLNDYPSSKWKIPVISMAYSMAVAVAVNRIRSGSHFLTDVITGAAIGSLYGYLVPTLHLKKNQNNTNIAIAPSVNSFMLSYSF